jgi:hypothetical protein
MPIYFLIINLITVIGITLSGILAPIDPEAAQIMALIALIAFSSHRFAVSWRVRQILKNAPIQ